MEILIFLVLIFAVFLYVMIRGAMEEKNQKKKYREQMKALYGSFQDRVYSAEEINKIARYYFTDRKKMILMKLHGMISAWTIFLRA